MQNSSTVTIDLGTCFSFWINFFRVTYRGTSRIHSGWKCLQKSQCLSIFTYSNINWQLRALKSPQKFWTPSFANFLGLKSKSYYEIWTFWSKLGLQMNQFHSSFLYCLWPLWKLRWEIFGDFKQYETRQRVENRRELKNCYYKKTPGHFSCMY